MSTPAEIIRMPDGPKEMNPRAWIVTKQGITGDLYEALAWDNGGKPLGVSVSTPTPLYEGEALRAKLTKLTEEEGLIQRLRAEPTASQFLRIGDLVESLVAERNEAADRIAALEAEKAERERQEPVAWAWNDALGCMHAHCGSRRPVWVDGECSDAKRAETSLRPLYAHPLALREPTDEECKRIAALWNIQGDYNATDLGRAMVRAVKEVLK